MNEDKKRFELMVELRGIAAEIRDDEINDRLVKLIDKLDDFIRHILFEECEA